VEAQQKRSPRPRLKPTEARLLHLPHLLPRLGLGVASLLNSSLLTRNLVMSSLLRRNRPMR
jgi:hypothetical protein